MNPTQERFTDRAYKVLDLAERLAVINNEEAISPEHILMGFAIEGVCEAMKLLRDSGVNSSCLQAKMKDYMTVFLEENRLSSSPRYIIAGPKVKRRASQEVNFDSDSLRILEEAHKYGESVGYVTTKDILLAMIKTPTSKSEVGKILRGYRIDESCLI